eukprot:g3397.t1
MSWTQRICNRLLAMVHAVGKAFALIHLNTVRYERGLSLLPALPGFDHAWVPRPTIRTTTWGLEYPSPTSPLVRMVGPMTWTSTTRGAIPNSGTNDDDLRRWLDNASASGTSVVYVSFGTNLDASPSIVRRLYAKLCRSSKEGYRTLWSSRMLAAVADEAEQSVEGHKGDGDVVTRRRCRVERWVNQQSVLGHPSVRLFVSHGGANSVHEAIAEAVPVIVVPLGLDQHDVASRAEASGAGTQIRYVATLLSSSPDAFVARLVAEIRAAIDNEAFVARANFLRRVVRRARGAAAAADYVEEILDVGWEWFSIDS